MSQRNLDNTTVPLRNSSRNLGTAGSTSNVLKQSSDAPRSSPLAANVTIAAEEEQAKSLADIPASTERKYSAVNLSSKSKDLVSESVDQSRRVTSFSSLAPGNEAARLRPDKTDPVSASANLRKDNITSSATGSGYLRGATSKDLNSSRHFYSQEETSRCADWINTNIKPHLDADLAQVFPDGKPLPIEPGEACDQALFGACRDGLLLWKMIDNVQPGVIDSKRIWKPAKNTAQVNENMTLILQGAQNIGVKLSNIGAADIINGTPHLILGLIWQIIKISLLSKINLNAVPGLARLLTDTERSDLSKVSNESLLMKWVNFHLAAADHEDVRIGNFTTDLKQGDIFAILLQQLVPRGTDLEKQVRQLFESYQKTNTIALKANKILEMALALGIKPLISAKELTQGNKELSIAFFAQLFERYPNLEESLAKHMDIIKNSKEHLDQLERIAELEKQLAEAQTELSVLKTSGKTVDTDLLSKQKLLDDTLNQKRQIEEQYEFEVSELKNQLSSKDEQNAKLEEINQSLTSDLSSVEDKHRKELDSEISKLNQKHQDKEKFFDQLQQEVKTIQDNNSNLESKLKVAHDSVLESQQYIELLQNQNQELTNNLQFASEKFEDQIDQLKRTHASQLESETSVKMKIIEGYEKQLKDISSDLESKNDIIKKAHAKKDEHLRIIQALESSSSALQSNIQRNDGEIHELKSKIETLEQEKSSLYESLQKEKVHVKEELDHEHALQNDKEDLKHKITQFQTQISEQKMEIDSLFKTIQGKDFEILQIKEKHASEIETLEEKKSSLIRAHQNELHSIKLKLTTKEEMLQKAETNIQTFQSTLTYFEATIQKYEAELQEASGKYETTVKEMEDDKRQLLVKHETVITELNSKLESNKQIISELKQNLETAYDNIAELQQKVQALESNREKLESTVANLNQTIEDLNEKSKESLRQNQEQISAIEKAHRNEIYEKEQNIMDLQQRTESLEGAIQDLMNENEMLASNSNSIKTSIQKYETDIYNLKIANANIISEKEAQAAEHEENISTYKRQLDAKEDVLVKAEHKKKELLKEIQSLNHNLSNLQDNYDRIVEVISKEHGDTHSINNPVGIFEKIISAQRSRVSELDGIITGLQVEIVQLRSSGQTQKETLATEVHDVRALLKNTEDELANWKSTCDILQRELEILSSKSALKPIDSDPTFMKLQAIIQSTSSIQASLKSTNMKHKPVAREIESNILKNMQELEAEANSIDQRLKS